MVAALLLPCPPGLLTRILANSISSTVLPRQGKSLLSQALLLMRGSAHSPSLVTSGSALPPAIHRQGGAAPARCRGHSPECYYQ